MMHWQDDTSRNIKSGTVLKTNECIYISILGPALFILYINDMCNVSMLMKSIVLVDDTNFF